MKKLVLGMAAASVIALGLACSGGTGGDPLDGGASSSSSSSSSTSTSSGEPSTCTEFTVGSPVGNGIGGSAESRVIVNAVSELAKSSIDVRDELTAQCKQIATSLKADPSQASAADAQTDERVKLKAWCALAVNAIIDQKTKAGGTLQVQFAPTACRLKVADKAACQAECAATAACDVKANPPKCTGGKLFVSCAGQCTSEAGAALECEGGSCTGTCAGTCNGSPTPQPPTTCNGTCDGRCSSACQASAGGRVQCTGACSGDFDPIDCRGGKLEGLCRVDAKCDTACDIRTAVKAACPAPVLSVTTSGSADPAAAALVKSTLESAMPKVIAIKSRSELEANSVSAFAGVVSSVTDIKAACIPPVVKATAEAADDITSTLQSAASIVGTIN